MTFFEVVQLIIGLVVGGDLLATLAIRGQVKTINDNLRDIITVQAQHATAIALLQAQNNRHETELMLVKAKYEDIAGFLATQGFKKRDGFPT